MNRPAGPPNWEQLYQEKPVEQINWYYPELEVDIIAAFKEFGIHSGDVLDLGTGPGTMAIALAKLGFIVTATDISSTAIQLAISKAALEGVKIDFRQDDIVDTKLATEFDYIFDRGCFHAIAADKRSTYVINVSQLLKSKGILILKCFSHKEQGPGPSRFTPEQIEAYFKGQFQILTIQETEFQVLRETKPKALLCVMKKLS